MEKSITRTSRCLAWMPEETRTMDTQMLGRDVRFDYSEHWVGWSILALRLVMGWTLFWLRQAA